MDNQEKNGRPGNPPHRTVLVITLKQNEDKANAAKLMLVMPVEPGNDCSGIKRNIARNEDDHEQNGPGLPNCSTKVPKTTLKATSATLQKTTDIKNPGASEFKDSLVRTQ